MAHGLNSEYLKVAIAGMRDRGIDFAPGLNAGEIGAAEAEHGFRFPPDLGALLQYALPLGERFPDWRAPGSDDVRERIEWPADGICFDIEHNAFWHSAWGSRPDTLEEALETARQAVRAAPPLIPIYGHRYLPATPCRPGNPVFSVYQTDIIHYGRDLPAYLWAEFRVPSPLPVSEPPREIDFWSDLAEW